MSEEYRIARRDRIARQALELLYQSGPMTAKELANRIGLPDGRRVAMALSWLPLKALVRKRRWHRLKGCAVSLTGPTSLLSRNNLAL